MYIIYMCKKFKRYLVIPDALTGLLHSWGWGLLSTPTAITIHSLDTANLIFACEDA
jgi:hypothetical protein